MSEKCESQRRRIGSTLVDGRDEREGTEISRDPRYREIDSSVKATPGQRETRNPAVETENLPRNLCRWMLGAVLNLPGLSS